MTLKVPYTDNLTTNAKLPGQIAVDMKAIEHEDQQDDQALVEEIQDRGDADKKLDSKITTEAQARKAGDDSEARDRRAADIDIKALIASVGKQLNTRIDNLANDMRAADESNLAAMTAKAERVAVGSDGPTFIRMLGRALHDPKIRDVVASIVKE